MSFKPDIENLNTVTDCLSALADINKSIGDIKFQLEYEPVGGDEWRHSAERALFVCKKVRRGISDKLAILRQAEKEQNVKMHMRVNDYLVKELMMQVSESTFKECARIAHLKGNSLELYQEGVDEQRNV